MKRIIILGSTGSIGKSTLAVLRQLGGDFRVLALSTNSNAKLLYEQARLFQPKLLCVRDNAAAGSLQAKIKSRRIKVFIGDEGLKEMLHQTAVDKVVVAISGMAALSPLLESLDSCQDIILANKEALVAAGPIIMEEVRKKGVRLLPVDSEQSAIWQCLNHEHKSKIRNIYLTASGGPFLHTAKKELKDVSLRQVLRHPCWKMGRKISVDSATLMNKGLEIIEAMHLFGIGPEVIKVLVHPQALIHSMVEFIDGVTLAQISSTDMRIPLQYALCYPERMPPAAEPLDFYKIKSLQFSRPDSDRFPCLALAYQAAYTLGTAPCVLNAANEVSVEAFLKKEINFVSIPVIIKAVLDRHINVPHPGLKEILEADRWARLKTQEAISSFKVTR